MHRRNQLPEAFALIFKGIARLKRSFPARHFTVDGRLVGDIGEVIASIYYDIELDEVSQPGHDGTTSDGRRVQIKATFQDALTFTSVPDYYLGLKLYENGSFEEIYNGPGQPIFDRYTHRKDIGEKLLRFPNSELLALSYGVAPALKIPRRHG